MSERPAIMIYVKDWLTDGKLRRCTPAARGVWFDLMCILHGCDEYGVARFPLRELARVAGASMAHVRELVDRGVLKGSDALAEPYSWRPSHAGKQGDPVLLVNADGGPCWYCSRFVRDEYVRKARGSGTRFTATDQPTKGQPEYSPKGGIGDAIGVPLGDESGTRQGDGLPIAFAVPESSVVKTEVTPNGTTPRTTEAGGVDPPDPAMPTAKAAIGLALRAAGFTLNHNSTLVEDVIARGIAPDVVLKHVIAARKAGKNQPVHYGLTVAISEADAPPPPSKPNLEDLNRERARQFAQQESAHATV